MICIYTGDDCLSCTCTACLVRRSPRFEAPEMVEVLRGVPTVRESLRRRPCPTGIPGSLDGVVPYQPSRCAGECTCCAWCRGEISELARERKWCTCPIRFNWSNCERDHSELVECRGGCKPMPIAMAVVVGPPSWLERALGWITRRLTW